MSGKIKIEMDDVVAVTQALASVIQRKGLQPDEFKTVRGAWENLMDAVTKLQRNAVIEKLYPVPPPQPPSSETPAVVEETPAPEVPSLPTDASEVSGIKEPELEPVSDLSIH